VIATFNNKEIVINALSNIGLDTTNIEVYDYSVLTNYNLVKGRVVRSLKDELELDFEQILFADDSATNLKMASQ